MTLDANFFSSENLLLQGFNRNSFKLQTFYYLLVSMNFTYAVALKPMLKNAESEASNFCDQPLFKIFHSPGNLKFVLERVTSISLYS